MAFTMIRILIALVIALAALAGWRQAEPPRPRDFRVLVFSKTAGFRHDSIPWGMKAVQKLGARNNFSVEWTEDAAAFDVANLARFAAIVMLNTSGDVLNESQQSAMERFMAAGGGFVGVHAAADTEPEWRWYGTLVGARFASHPAVQQATIHVRDRSHPSTSRLPESWTRTDEWYNFDAHPRTSIGERLTVLATVDESSYSGGSMGQDHPIAWCHELPNGGGRAWYTALGHTRESYAEPEFLDHLLGGIQWAARARPKS